MKYLLVWVLLLFPAVDIHAQPSARERRQTAMMDSRGFTVLTKASLASGSPYNSWGVLPVALEIDKAIGNHFSWVAGVQMTTARSSGFIQTCSNVTYHRTYAVNAKIAWVSNRWSTVFIRAEAGFSGVYTVIDRGHNPGRLKNTFFPCVMAEAYVGFRLGKRCELMASPLIVTPSYFKFSPRRILGELYTEANCVPLVFGIKF